MKILKILKKSKNLFLIIFVFYSILQLFALSINQISVSDNKPIDFKKFINFRLNQTSFGIWKKEETQTQPPMNLKGLGSFVIIGNHKSFVHSHFTQGIYGIEINLHDTQQSASNVTTFSLRTVKIEPSHNSVTFPPQLTLVRLLSTNANIEGKKCNISAHLFYKYFTAQQHYFVKLKIRSEDCPDMNTEINSNIQSTQIKYLESLMHVILIMVFVIVQIMALRTLDVQLSENERLGNQSSIITWLILSGCQLTLAFNQLLATQFDFPFYTLMLIIGIGQFVIFFFIIMRIIAALVKARLHYAHIHNINIPFKSYLLKIYLQAHLIVLGVFYSSVLYSNNPYFYLLWSLAILPQIIQNCTAEHRFIERNNKLTFIYLIVILQIIYDKYYKYNFKHVNIIPKFTIQTSLILIGITTILICIQTIQENYSSFFLIPSKFRKNQSHDYFTNFESLNEREITFDNDLNASLDTESEGSVSKDTNCLICLGSLKREVNDEEWAKEINNEQLLDYVKSKSEKFKLMATPCKHVYHSSCLLAWMNVKLECPLCKTPLPGIV